MAVRFAGSELGREAIADPLHRRHVAAHAADIAGRGIHEGLLGPEPEAAQVDLRGRAVAQPEAERRLPDVDGRAAGGSTRVAMEALRALIARLISGSSRGGTGPRRYVVQARDAALSPVEADAQRPDRVARSARPAARDSRFSSAGTDPGRVRGHGQRQGPPARPCPR